MSDVFAKRGLQPADQPVLLLAPLEGITDPIFRQLLCTIGGMDLVATEFVRITGARQGIPDFVRHAVPLQIQFMASDPAALGGALRQLLQRGRLSELDWLDLNAGCPARRVNAHGAGAVLLKQPGKLLAMIEEMRRVWTGPLSIKMRLGFDSSSEFQDLLRMLKDAPLDFITVHARTRAEARNSSSGINRKCLREAAEELPYPVIGNGDMWSAEDAIALWKECGLRGVMFGRPAVANPFLFRDVRRRLCDLPPVSASVRREELFRFAADYLAALSAAASPRQTFVGAWKGFCRWFSLNPLVGEGLFARMKPAGVLAECEAALSAVREGRHF